ncbi:unnamed protein product [Dicrocoelium dendriticum]|nr:unnamed protein product [Dicrocoelium dendriticum]
MRQMDFSSLDKLNLRRFSAIQSAVGRNLTGYQASVVNYKKAPNQEAQSRFTSLKNIRTPYSLMLGRQQIRHTSSAISKTYGYESIESKTKVPTVRINFRQTPTLSVGKNDRISDARYKVFSFPIHQKSGTKKLNTMTSLRVPTRPSKDEWNDTAFEDLFSAGSPSSLSDSSDCLSLSNVFDT